MKLEQRIGRIHRLGQDREVTIFNLALSKTIDEYVVKKLFEKLELFRDVIGGFEAILGELESDGKKLLRN
jgi:SNF2 family DNA or RNA helicase